MAPDGPGGARDTAITLVADEPPRHVGAPSTRAPQPGLPPDGRHPGDLLSCAALVRRVRSYDAQADIAAIEAAFDVARTAHADQRRDNGDPYITHPLTVATILAQMKLDTASIVTGLLHDTIEDTGLTLPQLQARFGDTVAGLVDGVTKLTRLELQSDRTKQAENFRKLVLAMSRDIRVLLVKLADRLHNMRTLHYVERQDRRQRIARETMDIYAPLAERIGIDRIKTELQNLSFVELEPEANATIRARLNYLRGQGADIIDEMRAEIARVCDEVGAQVIEVTGREKTPYSIWEKMQRHNVAFEQLSDIMAFRVLVPSREACYVALGALHGTYPVIAGRFKDYISTPKPNGYQSLHTGVTLRSPRNQKIEVQIRTPQMHDVAENGVASHWLYKQPDTHAKPSDAQKSRQATAAPMPQLRRLRWVQDLLEILENSAAPDEFLENTKLELYQDQVFCFTPKGQLIQLPRGATPVDFAYAVHSQVGDTCVGAKVNGRLMPLRHELANGDQVEIMTARGGTPSPAWERFVVTGKARARIRRTIAAAQRQQHLDTGRAALTRAFRQDGVDGSEKVLETVLAAFKASSLADLCVAVGAGSIAAREVVHTAYPELRRTARAPRMVPSFPSRMRPKLPGAGSSLALTGLGSGIAVHFAGCCHPLPGDRIVGIVATGKGVTVHTRDCTTLASFADTPERFMDIDWDYDAVRERSAEPHVGRISVVGANEPAMLATLTNAVAKHDGSVVNLKIVNRQMDFMETLIDVEVRDLRHLSSVIAGLRGAAGVAQVERARG